MKVTTISAIPVPLHKSRNEFSESNIKFDVLYLYVILMYIVIHLQDVVPITILRKLNRMAAYYT